MPEPGDSVGTAPAAAGRAARPLVSVIIPARDEGCRVGETVRAVRRARFADEVIVVDDGSRDDTAAAARAAGAAVVSLGRNVGKGGALNRGVEAARGEILVFLDADLGATAALGGGLVAPVREGLADMAVAVFPRRPRRGGFGFVIRTARWGVRILTGLALQAPLSGQRAMRRAVLLRVGGCDAGFGAEAGLTVDAARQGFRILEVALDMDHAVTGRDLAGFWHRGRQFRAVVTALCRRGLVAACVRRLWCRWAGAGIPGA